MIAINDLIYIHYSSVGSCKNNFIHLSKVQECSHLRINADEDMNKL